MRFTVISRITTRFIVPLMFVFSFYVYVIGHTGPGGGFSGGLIAAAVYALYAIAYGTPQFKGRLARVPGDLVGVGLATALAGALLPLALGRAFFQAAWFHVPLGFAGSFEVGTPYLFELGVYLAVAGVLTRVTVAMELATRPEEED